MSQKCNKNIHKYVCQTCSFSCSNRYNWEKHLYTLKHKNGNKTENKINEKEDTNKMYVSIYVCTTCNKKYKYRSGLSRHKKKCIQNNDTQLLPRVNQKYNKITDNGEIVNTFNKVLDTVVKQQQQINTLMDIQRDMIPKMGNNNQMTINVFLNEHCKDAMNLTDFINNIKISLEDLEYTNQHGYVKGVSNIFAKHLSAAGEKQRPIHCSDRKRLHFYVKEGDTWDRDPKNSKIDQSITAVTNKAFNELKHWQDAHPGYDDISSPVNKEWLEMIRKLSGGSSEGDIQKNTDSIKKNMSESISIREAISIKS